MATKMDGMDSDVYEDMPSQNEGSVDQQEQEEAAGSDLMSKSSFPGGCKVGDTYTIQITADHGDQFAVKVEKPDEEKEPTETPEGDDELASMNSKY